ncbi:MAG: tetratricopeptide repeat protein [bacterium]|nr:tetratricopeptide repeat protein [bacterium]
MTKWVRGLDLMGVLIAGTLLATVPALIDPFIKEGSGPETKFRLFEYGVLLLSLIVSLRWCVSRERRFVMGAPGASALLFAGYCLLRAALDDHRGFAFDEGMQTVAWLLFAPLIASVCRNRRDWIVLLSTAAICQLFPVIYAIGETFGVDIYFTYYRGMPGVKWKNNLIGTDRAIIWSSLGQPNYFAIYAGLLLGILIILLTQYRSRVARVLWGMFSLAVLYTIFYTYSRGILLSMTAAGVMCTGFLFLYAGVRESGWRGAWLKYRKPAVIVMLIAAIGLSGLYGAESLAGGGPLHRVGKRFYHGVTMRDASMRARPLMWTGALRMWRDRPLLGVGHGRYQPLYLDSLFTLANEMESSGVSANRIRIITRQLNTIRSDRAHNDYIQYLAETGLIGFSLFLLVLGASLLSAARVLWRAGLEAPAWRMLFGFSFMTLIVLFHAAYDFPLRLPASALFFGLAIGGVEWFARRYDTRLEWRVSAWMKITLAAILAFAWFGGGTVIVRHYYASHLRDSGTKIIQDAEPYADANPDLHLRKMSAARSYLTQANELYPGDGRILTLLGSVYSALVQHYGGSYREQAFTFLQRAKETFNSPGLIESMGYANLDKSMYAAAREQADRLLTINPEEKGVHYLAGLVDYKTGRTEDALRQFEIETKIDPDNAKAWNYIGAIYQNQLDSPEAAVQAYEQSLRIEPNVVNTLYQLGELYGYALNRPEKALSCYDRALDLARLANSDAWQAKIRVKLNDVKRRMGSNT